MKCFVHPSLEAVGACKYCFKGICSSCARDTPVGLVCSDRCEAEVRSIKEIVERNRKMLPVAARSHMRSAVILFAMCIIFFGFGTLQERSSSFQLFLIAMGTVMLMGAGFAVLNSRRITKLQR
jgi:hypothetical protein